MRPQDGMYFNQVQAGKPPIAIISQLIHDAAAMQHIDEVFLWLSRAIAQEWQIPVVEFWTVQAYSNGPYQGELRAIAGQQLPLQHIANREITEAVEYLLQDGRIVASEPLRNIFSATQFEVFAHYGLHFWSSYFTEKNVLLPFKKGEDARGKISTPLRLVVTLLLPQMAPATLIRNTGFLLEQALRVAMSRGFFTADKPPLAENPPVENIPGNVTAPGQYQLSSLIPRQTHQVEDLQASNPFANAVVISDKKARQVYSSVDGQKNVAQIASTAQLGQAEMMQALRILLQQGRIDLYDVQGNLIERALLLKLL